VQQHFSCYQSLSVLAFTTLNFLSIDFILNLLLLIVHQLLESDVFVEVSFDLPTRGFGWLPSSVSFRLTVAVFSFLILLP
jgi:hypothetical protein